LNFKDRIGIAFEFCGAELKADAGTVEEIPAESCVALHTGAGAPSSPATVLTQSSAPLAPPDALAVTSVSRGVVRFPGMMLRVAWLTLRARWVALRARWVALRARWVALRARWVDAKSSPRESSSPPTAERVHCSHSTPRTLPQTRR
jgi:hypothetical protein